MVLIAIISSFADLLPLCWLLQDNRNNACTGVDTATVAGETPAPVAPVAPNAPTPTPPGAPDAPTSGAMAWTTVSGAAAGLLVAFGLF